MRIVAALRLFAVVVILIFSFSMQVPSAAAQTCAQDLFTAAGNKQKLNCTANDVRITSASNPRDLSGNPIPTCTTGQKLDFLVDFNVVTTSSSSRSNVGLYLGTIPVGQPKSSALTGTCTDNIISPRHLTGVSTSCNPVTTPNCLGDSSYQELDGSTADNCGDTSASSTDIVTVELDNVVCPAVGATAIVLPDCTTWQVPGKTIACFSDPGSGWLFVNAAIPGSPSKCDCGTVSIPITPINPSISVTKTPSPSSIVEPGGDFTFTVGVTNNSAGAVDVTINQICDDRYGNIATAITTPAQDPCPAGNLCPAGSLPGSTCATDIAAGCSLPQTLAQNGSLSTCTFKGNVTGNEPMTSKDTITVNGVSGSATVTGKASATVAIGEAAASAQVLKSLDGGQECATARYKIEVDNLSAAGTDETETLTALTDSSFGDITKLGSPIPPTTKPTVVGTTCGVANGIGTLTGTAGAGTFSTTPIAVGGKYTCEFDGEFCGALGSGTIGGCTTAVENKDTVTASLTLDGDGVCAGGTNAGNLCASDTDCPSSTCTLTLSPTATLTVNSCFTTNP